MNPHDNEILKEISHRLTELGINENDEDIIRDLARQWMLVVSENTIDNITDPLRKQSAITNQKIKPVDRSRRVLIVSYRFDPEITGGAELHTWKLAQELVKAGMVVDVFTTRNRVFQPTSAYGIKWENNSSKGMFEIDGIRVHRFTTFNLPRFISRGMSYLIRRRRDWEDSRIDTSKLPGARLGKGWHDVERWNGGESVRWTSHQEAQFVLAEKNVSGLSVEVFSPRSTSVILSIGQDKNSINLTPGEWRKLQLTFEPRHNPFGFLRINRLWRPKDDNRKLGVAVRNIRYKSENKWLKIPIDRDLNWTLGQLKGENIVSVFRQLIKERPRFYDWLYMLARGPLALWMYAQIYSQAPKYHAIIANMVPFDTLCFASWAGKRKKVPVLLLPLMHHRDHYHHWGHFYRAMERSWTVMANSRFSEKLFRGLGYNAVFVGAGVDPIKYSNPRISGKRFRRKYQLEKVPIALFVGRKIHSKRYDMAVESVEIVNSKGRDLRLVMIGPDEDGAPISSPFVLYAGKVSGDELLDAYDACDIFVLPSELESFGMVYIEAWMRKKPVIGLKMCDAVATLIDDGKDGFLCQNAEEIADRMLYLLDNAKKALLMGNRGFEKTMENHTWERIGDKIIELLDKI